MTTLPVREMVLYKHGVGFFVREGVVTGESAALTFRQDEINDVLKSLAVFDKGGGQVLGIHYQTPMDIDARLASSSIRLSEQASLGDLLSALRGRQVRLAVQTGADKPTYFTGRMLGTDDLQQEQDYYEGKRSKHNKRVSLVIEGSGVVSFDWLAVSELQILDAQSSHDLTYFLDTSMSEDTRRTVNVRLSAGDHELVVYYVAPSPTWRVSYRLVAEIDPDGNGETGKALLQGWGLFDNRLEEDLEDVQVTLVAGQPISFIYDLYESRIPVRPLVKDESRVAPGPVEFDAAYEALADYDGEAEEDERIRGVSMPKRMMASMAAPAPAMYERAPAGGRAAFGSATPPAATAKDAGEFFQYAVTAPVSVKRGESALVPIIGSEIKYDRELLYNRAKLPDHPVVALRFDNSTGLTLERGPVTVVEDWDYKGEAIIPFTKDGSGVYVPFAVELGVRVSERNDHSTSTTGLHIKDAMFVYEQYETSRTTYVVENTTTKPVSVLIEAPIDARWSLYETAVPTVETATERRWKVSLPARSKTEFVRQERLRTYRHEQVRQVTYHQLEEFTKRGWLDQVIRGSLAMLLDEVSTVEKATRKLKALDVETGKLAKQQEQQRANLGALQPTGQEAALRNRILGQLEASQNRIEEIEQEVQALNRQIATSEKKIEDLVLNLG